MLFRAYMLLHLHVICESALDRQKLPTVGWPRPHRATRCVRGFRHKHCISHIIILFTVTRCENALFWPAHWLKLQDVLKLAKFGKMQGPETLINIARMIIAAILHSTQRRLMSCIEATSI